MNNNDILRGIRFALEISNSAMTDIFKLAGHDITEAAILKIMRREDESDYEECSDKELEIFLDGLIIQKRGKRETAEEEPAVKPEVRLTNNIILKKLRIAFNFKEEDMLEMFKLSQFEITRPELSALFRKKGHKNYKVCGDQIVKHFLRGITVHFRK